MTNSKNKPWVLITGANGGIGQALVKEFIDEGYQVIATDINEEKNDKSNNFTYIQLDLVEFVVDEEYADIFVTKVSKVTNGLGITALINNAAIQILAPTEKLNRKQWQTSLTVNLSAPFFMIQSFLNELTGNDGAVVNISSIHATQTKKEFVAYATSKAGLSSMTRNLAIDLGDRIRINAIEPAAISTSMLMAGFDGKNEKLEELEAYHPLKRIGNPKNVAELVVFLCSKKSNFVHGACISISGGIKNCLSDPR